MNYWISIWRDVHDNAVKTLGRGDWNWVLEQLEKYEVKDDKYSAFLLNLTHFVGVHVAHLSCRLVAVLELGEDIHDVDTDSRSCDAVISSHLIAGHRSMLSCLKQGTNRACGEQRHPPPPDSSLAATLPNGHLRWGRWAYSEVRMEIWLPPAGHK